MQSHQITHITFTDKHFGSIEGMTRLDPQDLFETRMSQQLSLRTINYSDLLLAKQNSQVKLWQKMKVGAFSLTRRHDLSQLSIEDFTFG